MLTIRTLPGEEPKTTPSVEEIRAHLVRIVHEANNPKKEHLTALGRDDVLSSIKVPDGGLTLQPL